MLPAGFCPSLLAETASGGPGAFVMLALRRLLGNGKFRVFAPAGKDAAGVRRSGFFVHPQPDFPPRVYRLSTEISHRSGLSDSRLQERSGLAAASGPASAGKRQKRGAGAALQRGPAALFLPGFASDFCGSGTAVLGADLGAFPPVCGGGDSTAFILARAVESAVYSVPAGPGARRSAASGKPAAEMAASGYSPARVPASGQGRGDHSGRPAGNPDQLGIPARVHGHGRGRDFPARRHSGRVRSRLRPAPAHGVLRRYAGAHRSFRAHIPALQNGARNRGSSARYGLHRGRNLPRGRPRHVRWLAAAGGTVPYGPHGSGRGGRPGRAAARHVLSRCGGARRLAAPGQRVHHRRGPGPADQAGGSGMGLAKPFPGAGMAPAGACAHLRGRPQNLGGQPPDTLRKSGHGRARGWRGAARRERERLRGPVLDARKPQQALAGAHAGVARMAADLRPDAFLLPHGAVPAEISAAGGSGSARSEDGIQRFGAGHLRSGRLAGPGHAPAVGTDADSAGIRASARRAQGSQGGRPRLSRAGHF